MTICHQLAAFGRQPLFQLVPVLAGGQAIGLVGEHLDDVDDGKPPDPGVFVIDATDGLVFELGGQLIHGNSFALGGGGQTITGLSTACFTVAATDRMGCDYIWPEKAWCSRDCLSSSRAASLRV